nr:hypothetical protein [Tanacetum cinerariifolium]
VRCMSTNEIRGFVQLGKGQGHMGRSGRGHGKKIEETLNLRYLEDKPNVQSLGQEWYFDLDYLTDSLGYTHFKTNTPAGTDDTSILVGPIVQDVSAPMENNLDYAEELARLQRQEYKAHSTTAKHGFEFFVDTAALLPQANIEIRRNLVPAASDHAGGIVPTCGVPAGSDPAGGIVPTGGVLVGSSVPASDVPAGSIHARSVPAGGVLAGSLVSTDSAASSVPAASVFVPAVVPTDPAANSPLPPVHSLGSCAHFTRFPSPSDLGNHQHTAGIFSSSSYDDDFFVDVTNLDSNVVVDPVATKRVNSIHPQSQILGDLQSLVQTRSIVQSSKFGKSAFISYVQNQIRTNHADYLHCLFACFLSQLEPNSVATAFADPDWVAAMQEEMQQFYHQQVWKLVPLPAGKIAIGTKWILKNKRDVRGIVDRSHPTFPSICLIHGFYGLSNERQNVVKALYGLHQAPRAWYARLFTFLLKHHYRGGTIDKTLFLKKDSRHNILVQVYVDDIIFGSINKAWCDVFEVLMKGEYEMSAMGELTFFLGLQIKQLSDRIFISQDKYVKDMLKKFDIKSVRTATTPYEVPKHKSKDEPDDAVNVHLFRSMIGSLMYLTASRPDIMFAVSACSRHQLEAYSDSDYVGSHGDRKSTIGGCQFLGRRLISWQCKKQTVVATSSTEAEYVAAASCCGQRVSKAAGCTGTLAGGLALLYKDDHNKVAYLEKGKAGKLMNRFKTFSTGHTSGPSDIIAIIDGTEVVVTKSLIRTQLQLDDVNGLYKFTLHDILDGMRTIGFIVDGMLGNDGPHMPLLAPMLVVPAGGNAAGAAANVAAGPGPSSAPQVPPVNEHTPVREPSPVRDPSPVREPTPVREPSPRPVQEPTPDSPSPPFPPPSSAAVGPATSSRPPSPSRHPCVPEDIHEGGGDFVSSPQSNEAPQTPAATAAGEAEDSAALTALSLKLDRCLHRVTTLENELGITKKVFGSVVLKLVTRVKRLEGLLQQKKWRLVLSDSEGEDATTMEQEFDLAALHTLASATLGDDSSATAAGPDAETTMPVHSTRTTRRRLRKPFTSYVSAHVSETIPAGVRVPAGSSVDAAVYATVAPSYSIPTAADKGKAPMVDDSLPVDLLSEQERVLKNLHDFQLGEELAKKIRAEQEFEFAGQQDELAQKAQAESVAFPTEHAPGMSDQRCQELDVAQLIYTEADWLDLLAKIATNYALSKQLLGDHVTEENMNERLDAPPAKRATQGAPPVPPVSSQDPAGVPAAPSIPADVSLPAATSSAPADIPVPAVSIAHAAVSVPAEPMVHPAESHMDPPLTAHAHGSSEPTVSAPPPSSSRHRRKHIAKKRVTPIVDVADAAMIKFDSDSDSDDDPFTIRTSLDDADALHFWRTQDSWCICSWRLYPRAQVYVLEMVDGRVIYMFVDVSYPLSVGTLERMLKHGLEVSKLLVGGDLTMAKQLIGFIKAALLNAKSAD